MKRYFWLVCFVLLSVLYGCKPEASVPPTPFKGSIATGGGNTPPDSIPNPNSIVGLHKNIFSVKCANPGCHDGSFEPDFRTVQSTYYSLVYNNVIKNSEDSAFTYRVIPGDVAKSWLYERLITDNTVLGRMPLYSPKLSDAELTQVRTWIEQGAKDADNQPGSFPDLKPTISQYFAVRNDNQLRLDSIRLNNLSYNPFIVPESLSFTILYLVEDDNTPISQLTQCSISFSTNRDDFSQATVIPATFVQIGSFQLWQLVVQSSLWPSGTQVYLRFQANDGLHSSPTIFPASDALLYFKSYASFVVQ